MKRILQLLTPISFLFFFSCQKSSYDYLKNEHAQAAQDMAVKFFSFDGKLDTATKILFKEIKQRNETYNFVNGFSKTNGLPVWNKSLVMNSDNHDTIVYVPLVKNKTRQISGFIKAVINNNITISSFRANEYLNYPFSSNGVFSADHFVALLLFFEKSVFFNERFIITNPKLFNVLQSVENTKEREIKLLKSNIGNSHARATCDLLTLDMTWIEARPDNCNCLDPNNCDWASGCVICSQVKNASFSYVSCGGGSSEGSSGSTSTSSGGTWSPAPPPGGGGTSSSQISSNTPYYIYPNTQAYNDFVNNTLSPNEQDYWSDLNNAEFVDPLMLKVVKAKYSNEAVAFVQYWLEYLMGGPNITAKEFRNYFMTDTEGEDGTYDATFWDNPGVIYQQETLPSLAAFVSAFPKKTNTDGTISYMPANEVYNLVGGVMWQNYSNGIAGWRNACAIRASRALNYSGKPIGNAASSNIYQGGDGKNYIVQAKAFNTYMQKKFGNPTYTLNAAQINNDPQKIVDFLKGKNGIYSMVTSAGTFSGHADLLLNGTCLSGTATNNVANVSYIHIWELK